MDMPTLPPLPQALPLNGLENLPPENNIPGVNSSPYSDSQLEFLSNLQQEAQALFPIGATYDSYATLRDELRNFAHKKGFAVSSVGSKMTCTRAEAPQCDRNKKAKKEPLPIEKQRTRTSTRVGCCFQITCSPANWKNRKEDKTVVITKSSNYAHSNGCFPCRNQLVVEKRKAGSITVAIHESQIKAILAVMASGERVPIPMLRQMMKPLYPEGTSLDSRLIFNFRMKIKRMLACGVIDLESYTVTESDERNLLALEEADSSLSPSYLTEAFLQFQDLLKEALSDENDVKQIITYLESLAACDSTFSYRVGKSADGSVTGFVWQTGVMRRDFELFGDVLFLDAQGRSLNDKGWPINTVAMLDGQRKVCLPCEGITIAESVEGYAWLVQSTVSMAPGRQLSDIKVVFGDGIFSGESFLPRLGITENCRLILDHHHLLSEDIGAWPKEFGLPLFAKLKPELTAMVKSPDAQVYEQSLAQVRGQLLQNVKLSSYLETNIHAKRHLFANHIIKTYPGNLSLQGNAPAESNHSSIMSRIGNLVVTPVELVRALIKRHTDISAERNLKLQTYHYTSMATALKTTDESRALAIKTLSKWGYELYSKAVHHSTNLAHDTALDGTHNFSDGVQLPAASQSCKCRQWIATPGTQCKHLVLVAGGFCSASWSTRWLQRAELGSSAGVLAIDISDDTGTGADGGSGDGPACDDRPTDSVETQTISQSQSHNQSHLGLRDLMDVTRELAHSINKLRDKPKQKLLVGAVIKLSEIAKGNAKRISAQSLENILENQLSLFTRNMTSQPRFSQDDNGCDKENHGMRNAAPSYSSGGARFRSANERAMNSMKISKKRSAVCTLCFVPGHKVGRQCTVVLDHKAVVIGHREAPEFAAKLGNPAAVQVDSPDKVTKAAIMGWMQEEQSIPRSTRHVVVKRCFHSAKRTESCSNNVVEVHLLGESGADLLGYCPAYFPAHQVGFWISENCCVNGRKKHLLSSLAGSPPAMSQELYDYSP